MQSYLSPHLRFGTVSVRKMVNGLHTMPFFLSELIWGIFMQILYNFPEVTNNFKPAYDGIQC
jgi:deoxyribodipyrimidine photo-lyase